VAEDQAREAARRSAEEEIKLVWTGSDKCPICGNSEWNVLNLVDIPVRMVDPTIAMGISPTIVPRTAYVFVPVTCTTCGYTRFFHSGALGTGAGQAREKRDSGKQ